jgi:hypothetical protein
MLSIRLLSDQRVVSVCRMYSQRSLIITLFSCILLLYYTATIVRGEQHYTTAICVKTHVYTHHAARDYTASTARLMVITLV